MNPLELKNQIARLLSQYKLAEALDLLKKAAAEKGDRSMRRQMNDLAKIIRTLPPPKNGVNGVYDDPRCAQVANDIWEMTDRLVGGFAASAGPPDEGPTTSGSANTGNKPNPVGDVVFAKSAPSAPPPPKPISVAVATSGALLHNIAPKMEVNKAVDCIVRIAFERQLLKRADEKFENETIRDIEVTEIMGISLEAVDTEGVFKIETDTESRIQFLSRTEATEWNFKVTPLKQGNFKLRLKVTQFRNINGQQIPKMMSHVEDITIVSAKVKNTEGGKFRPVDLKLLTDLPDAPMKTILFMGASPPGTRKLDLKQENKEMLSKLKGKFKLKTDRFLRVDEIPELLVASNASVIHFSGHGKNAKTGEKGEILTGTNRGFGEDENDDNALGGIVVYDETGKKLKLIDDDIVEEFFKIATEKRKVPIEVVVFNSCYSDSQAQRVSQLVPYVVGTARAISDDVAIAFTSGFYDSISGGCTVEDAFKVGKMLVVVSDKREKDLIVLYRNGSQI